MRKICVLRAFLESTFLRKSFFSKKHDFECKFFSKKHDFERKSFCKKLDFELKLFRLVRFRINVSTTRQILNQLFYNAVDFEQIT